MLVAVEDDFPVGATDGEHAPVETPLGHGLGRSALTFDGEGVDVMTAEALHRRNQIGRDPLRNGGIAFS